MEKLGPSPAILTAAILALLTATSAATTPVADEKPVQEMVALPIRVVDADGQPVSGAVVIPWALRCSQGHGPWCVEGFGASNPPKLESDAKGRADVPYPRYSKLEERVITTEVTLSVDHPDFAFISHEFVNVPRDKLVRHTVTLQRGASVELVPFQDGKPASVKELYAIWSDGRSWQPGVSPAITDDGAVRIPTMRSGAGQVLLVRLDRDRATHFSPIVKLQLEEGATMREHVELRPAVQIEGELSEDVPRPVRNGRLKAETLRTDASEHVDWFTWVRIREDGTYIIEGWPAGEAIQIIAMCDGFIAESGEAPDVVKKRPNPNAFLRPQVFSPQAVGDRIVIRMTPTVHCEVEAVDEQGAPLEGVEIWAYPNVAWWNDGSQIYCRPLVRGERSLIERDYAASVDDAFPIPFTARTGANGRGIVELPAGDIKLRAEHGDYELPVVVGRRQQEVRLIAGEMNRVRLTLQPKGIEYLGEWDKLAGVLFGCTTDECRRLLEDPGFREKMMKVGARLEGAKDPTAPELLKSAYAEIAEAFNELEDEEEAEKWRRKAVSQAAKLESEREEDASASGP